MSHLNKLSRVGGGGWLEKLGIRLSQLSTKLKLKLKLKLSLAKRVDIGNFKLIFFHRTKKN